MTQHAYIPDPCYTVGPAITGRSAPGGLVPDGAARLASDPLYYASLTLTNVVGGSQYRVSRHDTGADLATGTVPGSGNVDYTITSIPCYANPQVADVTVRKGTAAPKYQPFDTRASIPKTGTTAYIAQVPDTIA